MTCVSPCYDQLRYLELDNNRVFTTSLIYNLFSKNYETSFGANIYGLVMSFCVYKQLYISRKMVDWEGGPKMLNTNPHRVVPYFEGHGKKKNDAK